MPSKKQSTPEVRVRVSLSLKPSEAEKLKAASNGHPATFAKWAALLLAERVNTTPLSQE